MATPDRTAKPKPKPTKRAKSWQEIASEQDGVLSRQQALGAGMTRAAWGWRLDRGLWSRLGPGVAATHSGSATGRQLSWAAVLHGGEGAALSGDAALVAWGMRRLTIRVHEVALPEDRQATDVDEDGLVVRFHRLSQLQKRVKKRARLPLAAPPVAVLHAAAWAKTDEEAETRLAMAVQQRITGAKHIRSALAEMPRLRRRALLLEVLDDIELGAHASSEIEFLRFCRRNRLPEPDELQVKVRAGGVRYLDARYRRQRVSVEIDGAHHMWVEQWDADAIRSLQLAAASRGTGELQIRITRANMRHSEAEVAGLLRTILL